MSHRLHAACRRLSRTRPAAAADGIDGRASALSCRPNRVTSSRRSAHDDAPCCRANAATFRRSSTGRRSSCRATRASCSGPSSTTRSGTSAGRCRARCCRRRPACRCCRTCRTGAGTNTACGSAPGGSSSSTSGSASGRRSRSMPASARTMRASPRRRSGTAGSSWATPTSRCRSTRSEDQAAMIERSHGHPRALHRQAAGRLARAGPHADAGDAGTAGRRRRQIYRRLGLRRRADDDPHRQGSAGHAALHGRDQRHPDDDRAAPRERISAAGARSTSSTGSTPRARTAPRSWRSRSTPTSAASRTASNTSKRSTTTSRRFEGVLHWNGARDSRLVPVAAKGTQAGVADWPTANGPVVADRKSRRFAHWTDRLAAATRHKSRCHGSAYRHRAVRLAVTFCSGSRPTTCPLIKWSPRPGLIAYVEMVNGGLGEACVALTLVPVVHGCP